MISNHGKNNSVDNAVQAVYVLAWLVFLLIISPLSGAPDAGTVSGRLVRLTVEPAL